MDELLYKINGVNMLDVIEEEMIRHQSNSHAVLSVGINGLFLVDLF